MKTAIIAREMSRIESKLEEAEKANALLVYQGGSDVVVAFSPKTLVKQITEGNWHAVEWNIVDRTTYLQKISEPLRKATDRYNELLQTLTQEI